jgi:hypothetical protein
MSVFTPTCALCRTDGPTVMMWAGFSTTLREQRKLDKENHVAWCSRCIDCWLETRRGFVLQFLGAQPPFRTGAAGDLYKGPCTRCGDEVNGCGPIDVDRKRVPGFLQKREEAPICSPCYEEWRSFIDGKFTEFLCAINEYLKR